MQRYNEHFVACLALDLVVGIAIGFALYDEEAGKVVYWGWAHTALECVGLLSTALALLTSGVQFGDPDLGPGNCCYHILGSIWSLLLPALIPILWFLGGYEIFIYPFLIVSLIFLRGLPLNVMAFGALALCYALEEHNVVSPFGFKLALACIACANTRHIHDQRLALGITGQSLVSSVIGLKIAGLSQKTENVWLVVGHCGIGAYIFAWNLLRRRRKRHLPPGLVGARFVRLGYLRKRLRGGEGILRCQELPNEAFGDPSKALYLIVVSHRWLDPRTCDVSTNRFPHGLKLSALLRKLEDHFSPRAFYRAGHGLGVFYRLSDAYFVGGWDVVIFFDFMSIPQHGIDAYGETIPRTLEEEAIFKECLPHMGALYSRFPVLVLVDVPEGDTVHDYMDSGWCTCELNVSMLGKQLGRYSEEALVAIDFQDSKLSLQMSASSFQQQVDQDLTAKHFEHDSDRMVAKGIIRGFLMKRLLADSIHRGSLQDMKRILSGLSDLQSTLDEPVDAHLNTLLHVAVRSRSEGAAKMLLAHGARPELRNLRGDKPMEWFALPRLGEAGHKCINKKKTSVQAPNAPDAQGVGASSGGAV